MFACAIQKAREKLLAMLCCSIEVTDKSFNRNTDKVTCFISTGQLYWYNLSRDTNCDELFPLFLMYNDGRLNGIGWVVMETMNSSRFVQSTSHSFEVRAVTDANDSFVFQFFRFHFSLSLFLCFPVSLSLCFSVSLFLSCFFVCFIHSFFVSLFLSLFVCLFPSINKYVLVYSMIGRLRFIIQVIIFSFYF